MITSKWFYERVLCLQAFGPVWTGLYAGMGYASYLAWRDGASTAALASYAVQLALNWAWTPIFFGLHDLRAAALEVSVLWLAVAATGLQFYSVNSAAGLLFLPYQAWVSLATALTISVWHRNGDRPEPGPPDHKED